MEKEKVKLINVLRRIARAAGYAAWTKPEPEAARFCITQYNKVLARLSELEPAVKTVFRPLEEEVSPEVTRMAARELLAYFEDEEPEPLVWRVARGRRSRLVRSHCLPFSARCE